MMSIDNSSTNGVIRSSIDYNWWNSAGGGLVGHIETIDKVNIVNSHNSGDITSITGSTARFIDSVYISTNLVNIDRSYNNGNIKSNGGAAGFIALNNNTVRTTTINSFNIGDIEGTFGVEGLLGGTLGQR